MDPPQNDKVRSFFALLASVSALFVVALYILGRVSAEIFYQRFGISVAASGLSTPDIVGLAAGWSMWILVLSFPAFFWGVLFTLDVDPETPNWLGWAIVIGTIAATFGLPLAAIFFLGDPSRTTDWALPIVSLGIGVTVLMLSLRDDGSAVGVDSWAGDHKTEKTPPGLPVAGEDGNSSTDEAAPPSEEVDASPAPTGEGVLRPALLKVEQASAFPYLVIIGILAIFAVVISLIGLRQQADDAYSGRVEHASPWSFAPSLSNVALVATKEESALPTGRCLVEITQSEGVWLLWDSSTHTLWRVATDGHALTGCSAGQPVNSERPGPSPNALNPTTPIAAPTPVSPTTRVSPTIPVTNGRG